MQKLADISLFESLGACPKADCSVFNYGTNLVPKSRRKDFRRLMKKMTPSELRYVLRLFGGAIPGVLGGGLAGAGLGYLAGLPFGLDAPQVFSALGGIGSGLLGSAIGEYMYGDRNDAYPKRGRLGRALLSRIAGLAMGAAGGALGGELGDTALKQRFFSTMGTGGLGVPVRFATHKGVGDFEIVGALSSIAAAKTLEGVGGDLSPVTKDKLRRIRLVEDDQAKGYFGPSTAKATMARIWYDDEDYVPMKDLFGDPSDELAIEG